MKKQSGFKWMELVIGIALILLGIFTFMNPGKTLTGAVMVYGIVAIITGIADIVFYVRAERYTGFGPAVALVTGILGVMAGVMLLAYPTAGKWIFLLVFPVWFITHCISRLSHLDMIRLVAGKFIYYVTLVINIVGIVLGVMMIFRPRIAFLSAAVVIGAYLILLGIDSIVMAFSRIGARNGKQ